MVDFYKNMATSNHAVSLDKNDQIKELFMPISSSRNLNSPKPCNNYSNTDNISLPLIRRKKQMKNLLHKSKSKHKNRKHRSYNSFNSIKSPLLRMNEAVQIYNQ